jgi:16S rRNA (guanine527-N7)-methyltransferase
VGSRGKLPVSPDPFHLSADTDERLRRWLEALVATPGLTSLTGEEARRVHLDQSIAVAGLVREYEGPIIDVGSGGGAPGIPLAVEFPQREVTLLDANRRKCLFLERWARELPNVRVVCGRAEEQPVDRWGVAVAKALASPPVAAEWCLPLVDAGGAALLWVGESANRDSVGRAAKQLGGLLLDDENGILVLDKVFPTPPGFPRRVGVARKRPLA